GPQHRPRAVASTASAVARSVRGSGRAVQRAERPSAAAGTPLRRLQRSRCPIALRKRGLAAALAEPQQREIELGRGSVGPAKEPPGEAGRLARRATAVRPRDTLRA